MEGGWSPEQPGLPAGSRSWFRDLQSSLPIQALPWSCGADFRAVQHCTLKETLWCENLASLLYQNSSIIRDLLLLFAAYVCSHWHGLTVGLDDPNGLSNLNDSMTLCSFRTSLSDWLFIDSLISVLLPLCLKVSGFFWPALPLFYILLPIGNLNFCFSY